MPRFIRNFIILISDYCSFALQHHLDTTPQAGKRHIAFLVTTNVLITQQVRNYQKYIRDNIRCVGLSGETDEIRLSLDLIVELTDVIVMTPQILLNAIEKRDVESLKIFSLIIFDECHHTMRDHPYNAIMAHYLDEVLEANWNPDVIKALPQVQVLELWGFR